MKNEEDFDSDFDFDLALDDLNEAYKELVYLLNEYQKKSDRDHWMVKKLIRDDISEVSETYNELYLIRMMKSERTTLQ